MREGNGFLPSVLKPLTPKKKGGDKKKKNDDDPDDPKA